VVRDAHSQPLGCDSALGPVAVVGAGSIGVGWAIVFARAGVAVRLHDADDRRLTAASEDIGGRLAALAEFSLVRAPVADLARRITMHAGLREAVSGAQHIQECVPEDLELKRGVFARLDALAPPTTPLASSSSAITASAIAERLPGRARCLVVHPGNPPYLLPIAELVAAPFTDEEVVDRTRTLLAAVGMSPVLVGAEIEGFVFNRLQGAVLREAYCLVRDGVVDVDDVDRVMRDGLGRRWSVVGPFETADLNARGGIAAHAARLGPAYERMGAERGQHDPWTPELVAKVTAARRARLPLDRWEERVAWRDRALMAVERARGHLDRP
jgi:L-gulonate 3-dehydrogenase